MPLTAKQSLDRIEARMREQAFEATRRMYERKKDRYLANRAVVLERMDIGWFPTMTQAELVQRLTAKRDEMRAIRRKRPNWAGNILMPDCEIACKVEAERLAVAA